MRIDEQIACAAPSAAAATTMPPADAVRRMYRRKFSLGDADDAILAHVWAFGLPITYLEVCRQPAAPGRLAKDDGESAGQRASLMLVPAVP